MRARIKKRCHGGIWLWWCTALGAHGYGCNPTEALKNWLEDLSRIVPNRPAWWDK